MQQQRSLKELHRTASPPVDRNTVNSGGTEMSTGGGVPTIGSNSNSSPSKPTGGGVKRFLNRAFGSNYSKKFLTNTDKVGTTINTAGSNSSRSRSEEDIKNPPRFGGKGGGQQKPANSSTFGFTRKSDKYSGKPPLAPVAKANNSFVSNGVKLEEKDKADDNKDDNGGLSDVPVSVSVASVVAALESYQKTQQLDLDTAPLSTAPKAVTKSHQNIPTLLTTPKPITMGNSCSYNVKQVPHHNHRQQAATLPDLRIIQVRRISCK